MSDHDEFLDEFIAESDEHLDVLIQELVALQTPPRPPERMRSATRTLHTIKGSSGFLGLIKTSVLALDGETLLNRVREGKFELDADVSEMLMDVADAIRLHLEQLGKDGTEGTFDNTALRERIRQKIEESDEAGTACDETSN